jgi:ParB family transcriptional regulator, chromosome partitioning protein
MASTARGGRLDLAALRRGHEATSFGHKDLAQPAEASAPSTAATGSDGTYLISVPVEKLVPNPRNSRDSLGDLEDLATIVDTQLQPATVVSRDAWLSLYPDDAEAIDDAEYIVVNGCRRLAAAQKFGRAELDIVVHDSVASDDKSVITAMLIENIAREDLDPIEEAKGVQMLVNASASQAAVARALGKSTGWVSKRLTLLKLDPEVLEAFREGRLKIHEAYELGRYPSGDQVAAWTAALDAQERPEPEPEREPEPESEPSDNDADDGEQPDPVEKIVRALRGAKADPETACAALEEFFDPTELIQVKAMLGK